MAPGRLRLHSPVKLLPAGVGHLGYLQGSAGLRDGLNLVKQLLSGS